jgi:hypothetical protein
LKKESAIPELKNRGIDLKMSRSKCKKLGKKKQVSEMRYLILIPRVKKEEP